VTWYQSAAAGGALISTSFNNVSVPAATWTLLTNTFTAPSTPNLAYQFAIDVVLGGTPAAGQIWYVDGVWATSYVTSQQSTVVSIESPGVWPGEIWPPLGTTVLA